MIGRHAGSMPVAEPTAARLAVAGGELARAHHGGLDRVQERGADACDLELADRGDRRAAGRGDHLAQLDRVHLQVAHLLRGAEHRLDDELGRDLAREAEQEAGLDHRLGEEREVGGPRARDRGDGVHQLLGHADDRAEMRERLLGERDVGVVGVGAGAEPGDSLVDDRRRVRHRADDRDAGGQVALDRGRRDRRGDREDRLVAGDQVADLAEQGLDVLRLDRDHDERRAGDGLLVRERRDDAVPLCELGRRARRGGSRRRCRPARASRTRAARR